MVDQPTLLIVDDELDHLDILAHHLEPLHYHIIRANNGEEALEVLYDGQEVNTVILDRMMPGLSGMDVLRKMKRDEVLKRIPVIFQSAMDDDADIRDGIEAGAYYYLTKPYNAKVLASVVASAVEHDNVIHKMESETSRAKEKMEMFQCGLSRMRQSRFTYRSIRGAHEIAPVLAACFKQPRRVAIGFVELMVNAVEHGNLGIDCESKSQWLLEGNYQDHLYFLQTQEENREKQVLVELERDQNSIAVTIRDQGNGFNWKNYLNFKPEQATSPNGRGIYIASKMFSTLEFLDEGRAVRCVAEGV